MSTNRPSAALIRAADTIVAEVRRLMVDRPPPVLVALDGASGSGKSTLARLIAAQLGAALVQSDDFVSASVLDDG
jgi:2-phosphoglycerate kinase